MFEPSKGTSGVPSVMSGATLVASLCACLVSSMVTADVGVDSIWDRKPTASSLTYSELTVDPDEMTQGAPQLVPLPQTAIAAGIGLATAFWIRRRASRS